MVAIGRRWPIVHLDVPPGVPKVPIIGLEPQQIALAFARPELFPYARFDIDGTEHIPAAGGAILCGNHRSYFDPAAVGLALARSGRSARFLGKKEVFDAPLVGHLVRAFGGIRVERGTGSDEPLKEAAIALEAGQLVALMPQGTIPRGPAFFDPVLKGRWGAARLAQLTGAPVIPIGLWGTERVWPRSSRLPDVMALVHPPTVRVRVGPPVDLAHESLDEDTERIMAAIVDLLPDEARQERVPNEDELAKTYPPGHKDE
jgi:putative phosphoserine phosphatase/1-acylglycerol-3-phosphate O-acyltransferase